MNSINIDISCQGGFWEEVGAAKVREEGSKSENKNGVPKSNPHSLVFLFGPPKVLKTLRILSFQETQDAYHSSDEIPGERSFSVFLQGPIKEEKFAVC